MLGSLKIGKYSYFTRTKKPAGKPVGQIVAVITAFVPPLSGHEIKRGWGLQTQKITLRDDDCPRVDFVCGTGDE